MMKVAVVQTGTLRRANFAKLPPDHHRKNTNVQFLPRDAMCKRGLCCRPVSVCDRSFCF